MRYAVAVLALGLGLSAVMPAAFAADREGREVSVATVTAQAEPSDSGTIAGPSMDQHQNQLDQNSHDRN